MRSLRTVAFALVGSLFLTTVAPAALIGGFPTGLKPDVYSGLIDFSYAANTHKLSVALGQAQSITTNSGSTTYNPLLASNSFTLTAYVDTSGNVISGDADALDILGPSSTISYHSGTGQDVTPLSAFGWVFNSEGGHTYQANFEFEYLEDSTAGALAQAGTLVYVTLYGTFTSSPNAPSFSANFSEISANGYSDAYPAVPAVVPEPSSAALLIGAAGLLWRRRRSA